jgi:acetoin utilization deacetylase AcuC-like enzyme
LAPGNDHDALLRVHTAAYIEEIQKAAPKEGLTHLDPDTVMSPGTLGALAHGVGGAVAAVNEVMRGAARNAFLATRPPGHHAEAAMPMGFCIYNYAAIAARHAQVVHGAERIAIVDFDVHHGNGTQAIFWSDPSVLYASSHELGIFPGTGAINEEGEYHNIVNGPLFAGADGTQFKEVYVTKLLPAIDAFQPDLIVISAGFDGHRLDPIGGLNLIESDYAWVTSKLMEIAEKYAKGRIVSVLEGGYDLEGLARSVAAHVLTLMDG